MAWLAAGSGIAFGAALGLLGAFFVTGRERFDRLAEWTFVLFAILGIPTAIAVADRTSGAGVAAQAVAAIGIAGIAGTGIGELATTLRLVDFRRVSALLTLAFVAILAWIGGVSIIAIATGSLPQALGWLGLASILAGIVVIAWIARIPGVVRGEVEPPRGVMAAFFLPMAGIIGWLVWLGASLG